MLVVWRDRRQLTPTTAHERDWLECHHELLRVENPKFTG
jgi:hypothetical protein